jgi:hypothetical protein
MLVFLVCLIMIYIRLGIGSNQKVSVAETWAVRIPFSVYLGWITVATIANVTDVLDYLRWGNWGLAPQVWAVIMLAVAVVVAALMAFTKRDSAYLAVLVWAFAGIAFKFQGINPVYSAAFVSTIAVAILMILSLFLKKRIPA